MKKMLGLAVAFVMLVSFQLQNVLAANVEGVKKHLKEALNSAEAMVSHGKQGHLDVLAEHAEEFIMHAQSALENIPADNAHGEEVVSHLKTAIDQAEKAIEHGSAGHDDVAMKHAKATLFNVKEAQSHAGAL
jgi:t-SNARE complex subunit (syntaxin)